MIGKLSIDDLEDVVIKHLTYKHPDVLARSSVGEDCAAIDLSGDILIASSDPITGTEKGLGALAVNINLNDLATTGCKPVGLMLTILAPPDTSKDAISQIVKDAALTAKKFDVEIIGGHTEWTAAVNQIVASVTALGRQSKRNFLNKPSIKSGDLIAVTKSVGIEGIGILAYEHESFLKKHLTESDVVLAKQMLNQTSVVKDGIIAKKFNPSAMHDVTEGGLLGGVWEMCYGADVGCKIDRAHIPIDSVSQKIANVLNIDILRLMSSGTMLITADKKTMSKIQAALKDENIELAVIGHITKDKQHVMIDKQSSSVIAPPKGDALYDAHVSY